MIWTSTAVVLFYDIAPDSESGRSPDIGKTLLNGFTQ